LQLLQDFSEYTFVYIGLGNVEEFELGPRT